jgi:hypothetical protein
MKKSRLIAIIASAVALSLSTTSTAAGEDTGISISANDFLYQKIPANTFFPQETIIGLTSSPARYYGGTTIKGPDNVWQVVFQPCSDTIIEYCIESVSWRKTGSAQWKDGTSTNWKPNPTDHVLTGVIGSSTRTETGWETYSESQYRDYFIHPESGLPRGGYAKVWNLEGATHGGGDNYTVAASVSYFREPNSLSGTQVFGMSIDPVKLDRATPKPLTSFPFSYGERYNFPTDIEYQVKVRTGNFKNTAGGWFNGRIFDPSISQVGSTLTLSGKPTRVLAAHTGPISCENNVILLKTPSSAEKCRTKDPSWASLVHPGSKSLGSSIEANTQSTATYPDGIFAYYEPILKPVGFTSEWNAYSWGVNKSGNCQIEDGKIALVSSNATLYSVNPPAWDPVEQSLAYRVGSLHLDHTGALHKGNFNLAVPKNFAKCLWGQNILNAKATVAITNADGTNNVATSVLSQDDQMIYFKVAGFTFSTPQIKVKLEIPKVEPTPTPTATIKPVPVQKTITCIKGKLVKKVSAVTPKCPVGFKKK